MKRDPLAVVGTPELCAWPVAPGAVWVQVRSPEVARGIQRRPDARQVAAAVAGGFMRTFEVQRGMGWARAFVARWSNPVKGAPAAA